MLAQTNMQAQVTELTLEKFIFHSHKCASTRKNTQIYVTA